MSAPAPPRRRLRILQVSHAWNEGGSALYAAALSDALAAHADVRRFGPETVPGRRGRGFGATVRDPAAERAFAEAVVGVDVVHIHHLSGLGASLPALAAGAGATLVVHLHDYWLACARGQLIDQGGARCVGPDPDRCARCLAPDLYAPVPPPLARRLPPRRGPVDAREDAWRATRRATHRFVSPSRHVADRLGVEAELLPYPLLQPVPPAPPAPGGPLRVLFLGSLLPSKGPDVLLAAFSGLPAGAATLHIVGPSPPWRGSTRWADDLAARARTTPGVRVDGMLGRDGVIAALHAADVLVVPSTWEENAPLVLSEARAAGVRIIASDIGGIPEVAPGARLVEPGSAGALRDALAAEARAPRTRERPAPALGLAEHARAVLDLYARAGARAPA